MTIYAKRNIKVWTDYPLTHTDDHVMKEVTLLSFDENKYCQVEYLGEVYEVKAGYLYKTSDTFNMCGLSYYSVTKLLLPRKEFSLWRKIERREKSKVCYSIAVDDECMHNSRRFSSLREALFTLASITPSEHHYVALWKEVGRYNSDSLMEYDYDTIDWTVWTIDNRPLLKSRRIGKEHTYKQWRK